MKRGREADIEVFNGFRQDGVEREGLVTRGGEHLVKRAVKCEDVAAAERENAVCADRILERVENTQAGGVHLREVTLRNGEKMREHGEFQNGIYAALIAREGGEVYAVKVAGIPFDLL